MAWCVHVANLLAGGTGVVYGAMRYCMQPQDEFAVVNHPWQPHLQHLHVLLTPLLVLVLGHLLIVHAWPRWVLGARDGRWTGAILALACVPMIFSGYAIQTCVNADWRNLWVGIHLASSVCWVPILVLHSVSPVRRRFRSGQRRKGGSREWR